MLTRIIFIVVLPALMACEALKELGNPTGPEEEEIVEEVASAPEEEDPVEAIEEPAPEVAALSSDDALQALEDLGVPYSQRSFIKHAAAGDLEVVRLFVWAGMDVDVQPYTARTVLVPNRDKPTALSHLESSWFPQEGQDDDSPDEGGWQRPY